MALFLQRADIPPLTCLRGLFCTLSICCMNPELHTVCRNLEARFCIHWLPPYLKLTQFIGNTTFLIVVERENEKLKAADNNCDQAVIQTFKEMLILTNTYRKEVKVLRGALHVCDGGRSLYVTPCYIYCAKMAGDVSTGPINCEKQETQI